MSAQKVMGAGRSSLIEHMSSTPNLNRLSVACLKMTPENDLTVAVKGTKKTNRKMSKSTMMMKFCFNHNLLKTWLA